MNVPAFESLHSPHDEAVMTGRRFRKPQIRQLPVPNGFVVRRLSYWTRLLFPPAVIARTLGGFKMGRDFGTDEKWFLQRLFGGIMTVELHLLRKLSLPSG